MEKAKRNRLVRAIGVIIAIVFLALGAGLIETNANGLVNHWDGTNGSFTVDESLENQTIIVFTEVSSGNCPEFRFEVMDDEEKTPLPVEKKDCSEWYADDVWQYRIGTLEPGRYTFTASDDVSIVAVNGDVDEYLENYALGKGLEDIGTCFCCLSFVVPFILGRMSSRTMDSGHHFELNDSFVMPTPYEGPSESPATALDAEDHGAEPATEEPDAEPATEVEDEESTAEEQDAESANEDEKEQPEGAFWGGLNND